MRDDVPSRTAAWVAAMRGMASYLAPPLRLVEDPFAFRFVAPLQRIQENARIAAGARRTSRLWLRGRLRRSVILLQLRTRILDEDVGAFLGRGGRQLVLLGAGFDCRAWRLPELQGAIVYEVDHPATQAKKRALVGREVPRARVVFMPWDFEREPLDRLPARLGLEGHDPSSPSMTISEGVLPYLTDEATEATFACVARYSSPGSNLSFTYFDRALLSDPSRNAAGVRMAVRLLGEQFRNGFDPVALPAWLAARGFRLERDCSAVDLAASLYPTGTGVERLLSRTDGARRHFASARIPER